MRRAFISSLLCMGLATQACAEPAAVQELSFHGLSADQNEPLTNPDRGLRLEMLLAVDEGTPITARMEGNRSDRDAQDEHGLTLTQAYLYLTDYHDRELSDSMLERIEQAFDALRERGLKAVLRMAYQNSADDGKGATPEKIQRHIEQLQPLLRDNADVIHVLQADFIGPWGEWHNDTHDLHQDPDAMRMVVRELLGAVPGRQVQVRLPRYKRTVFHEDARLSPRTAHTDRPLARVGFHNDYFLAREHRWDISPGTTDFEHFDSESPYLLIDGEMPWSWDGQGGDPVDGLDAAARLMEHRYTSFSIVHGQNKSIDPWKEEPLTRDEAEQRGLSISDSYFTDEQGEPAQRTIFEYIRDHLGYRLEAQHATLPEALGTGETFSTTLGLINRGFATLHHERPAVWVLIDEQDRVHELGKTEVDVRRWQPHDPRDAQREPLVHQIEFEAALPAGLEPGEYRVGLWLPDPSERLQQDARFAIRLANRELWWESPDERFGINVLGELRVR